MRPVVALLLAMLALPAMAAAGWTHYDNERFAFGIDVPPGFVAEGEAANGDGQGFATPVAELRAFGENIFTGDFEGKVRARQAWSASQGWLLTGQTVTPGLASFEAKKGGRLLAARMIALCGGAQYAMFEFDYSRADIAAMAPVIERLAQSLRANRACK